MLVSLSIRNFILIEDAVLDFGSGLTVLTGETGAGKTLLTRALGLLLGERAEDGLVGAAADEAVIEATFDIDGDGLDDLPDQIADLLEPDKGQLVVTRRLSREGRNRCYMNGTTVTLSVMRDVLSRLLSFAGQHEYRRLLDASYQLDVLDVWAGPEAVALAREFRRVFHEAQAAARALEEAEHSRDARQRELRLLRFEVEELTSAGLSLDEEEALTAEQRRLASAEELLQGAGLAAGLLSGDGDAPDAAGLLAQAAAQLGRLAGIDSDLDQAAGRLQELHYGLTDLARDLHAQVERITVDPERLQAVDARLRLYSDLGRKYGGSTLAILEHLEQAEVRLSVLEKSEDDLEALRDARAARCALALDLAGRLSECRRTAIPALERAVRAELADLGMPDAVFTVTLSGRPGWEGLRDGGAESVEFLLSANPGVPARPLASTASGGELSRMLLAVKCALADVSEEDETLVFDEIDAGIGGRTAVAVGAKLRQLSCGSQVLVVTHLPSVAAVADRHYLVEKVTGAAAEEPAGSLEAGLASTRLTLLDETGVVEELCHMMGGDRDNKEAMAHARELRDRAHTSC